MGKLYVVPLYLDGSVVEIYTTKDYNNAIQKIKSVGAPNDENIMYYEKAVVFECELDTSSEKDVAWSGYIYRNGKWEFTVREYKEG